MADPITFLRTKLSKVGFEKAIETVTAERTANPDFHIDENEINDWGYRLMSNGNVKQATEIFKLNVSLFPTSWNTYDSYGEALLKAGQKDLAIKMYNKSIELNPNNSHGKKVLADLQKLKG